MISFVILYMISCCKQNCVVVLAPYLNNQHPVESFNVKTDFGLQGTAWCGMRALNSSSTAPCVRQAPRGKEEFTRRYPWCISARLRPLS